MVFGVDVYSFFYNISDAFYIFLNSVSDGVLVSSSISFLVFCVSLFFLCSFIFCLFLIPFKIISIIMRLFYA